MKAVITLALLLASTSFACSQSFLTPGYYVKANGDTARGNFDSKDLENGYTRCTVRDGLGNPTAFSPFEVKAYGTDSTHYEARKTADADGETTLFYRVIFRGDLSLYQAADEKLFIGADSLEKVFAIRNKNMLQYMAASQPQMKDKITRARRLDTEFLIKLLTDMHDNVGKRDYEVYAEKELPSASAFYVYTGIINGRYSSAETLDEPLGGLMPAVGVGVELFPTGRNNRSFSFVIDVAAYSEKYSGDVVEEFISVTKTTKYELSAFAVAPSLGVKGRFVRRPKTQLYILAALGYNLLFSKDGAAELWSEYYAAEPRLIGEKEVTFYQKNFINVQAGLGIEKRLGRKLGFLDVRAERGAAATQNVFKITARLGLRF
jgi:hypothetical protein